MWTVGTIELKSRLLLGSSQYPSPHELQESIRASEAEIVTVALRRQSPAENGGGSFWNLIRSLNVKILPNTAGCRVASEAITLAQMSREIFQTDWIKLEVTSDEYTLEPDPVELLLAAKELVLQGFRVFAYTTDSLVMCEKLFALGVTAVMPWASPIGSGRGPRDVVALEAMRSRFPNQLLIVDAGIGKPSHAAMVMELGYDAVLINSAVALSHECATMARAFGLAVNAGRLAYEAGMMPERKFAVASTPIIGTPFRHPEQFESPLRIHD